MQQQSKLKNKMKKSFFQQQKVTATFSAVSFLAGIIFIQTKLTGNIIGSKIVSPNLTSIIGLLLLACSVATAFYTIKNK
jgi:uncharacterized membrane protein YraQ (UPF0718 family)